MRLNTAMRLPVLSWLTAIVLTICVGHDSVRADSIWNAASSQPSSLFSATKGEFNIGDIITIIVVESFNATNKTGTGTDKDRELTMGFTGYDNYYGLSHLFGEPFSDDIGFGTDVESEFDGSGSSNRSSTITGTVTGQITEVLPNGNLRIEASQTTVINEEKNSVILLGTIRPQDISSENTIFSTQISNAEIRYEGVGPLSTVQKRGVLTEFFEYIWPF